MPTAPPSRCTEQGCREYSTYKGKCDTHYKPWAVKSARNKRYSPSELARWRKQVLERDPVCVHCRKDPATEADHIIPVSLGGAGLDLGNGQGLCSLCHWIKTKQEIAASNRRRAGKPPQPRTDAL